ncbi:MAG: hypothetical protein QOD11_2406 [Bradyrhizobium sp.]|jgi:hypothetical protein|nr:hypothetical protein [Bradyrhizobium sp.]
MRRSFPKFAVMAGPGPAIHVFFHDKPQDVDARAKPGHDDVFGGVRAS